MSVSPPPSNAVLGQQLADVIGRLDRLTTVLEDRYVRSDVLAALQAATNVQLAGLEDELRIMNKRFERSEDNAATNRRLIVASFLAPIVVGVIVVIILSAVGLHK